MSSEPTPCVACGRTNDVMWLSVDMDTESIPICQIDQLILLGGGKFAPPEMSPTKQGRRYWAELNAAQEKKMDIPRGD